MMDGAIVMGAQEFGGTIDVTPRVTTVVLFGEADLAARAAFHDFLGEALETTTPRIEVDLAGLTYLESACLRSLINAHAAAAAQGRHLRVIYASGVVLRVLEVAGVAEILAADPTDDG
jgi:anti-sigma B factor antagonist